MPISRNIAKIRGNVLFIILIAVALFSALTMAITRSDRSATNMDRERGAISASDVLSYGGGLEKAVARMMSDGTISENGLSFENDVWVFNSGSPTSPAANYPNCTSDRCKVFHPAGGGVNLQVFPEQNLPTPLHVNDVKSGHAGIWNIAIEGIGTSDRDLVFILSAIDQHTCKSINDLLKVPNPSGSPPGDQWNGAIMFNGTYNGPGNATDTIGDMATQLRGKSSGCVRRLAGANDEKDNYFYQVLIPR